MYPDPITPKAHPDLLQRAEYDPFGVMPVLDARPRLFATAGHFTRAKARLEKGEPIDVACFKTLLAKCTPRDASPPAIDSHGSFMKALDHGRRDAVAYFLTGEPGHRQAALDAFRRLAPAVTRLAWTGHETSAITGLAELYDLLAADGLAQADDAAGRAALLALPRELDKLTHRTCNNHNVFNIAARLSLGIALGDRQITHDALYGCQRESGWRYGLIHQLRHDILADGMQWEGTMGYHMLVMGGLFQAAHALECAGVDIWRRSFPSLNQDDGFDQHRGWGPKGEKHLFAGLDALIYQMFSNGDYSNLHDQILGNIRGTWVWWPLFARAYEITHDPRFAWVLRRSIDTYPGEPGSPLPPWMRNENGDLEFIRLEGRDFPAGPPEANPLVKDAKISLVGRHVNDCSLFPVHGSVVLRADASREDAPGAYLYFGPDSAGHRSPAALHLEIHAQGRRFTHAPHIYDAGYDDPRHLNWNRATIAHNTVTVDEASQFPFDYETDSPWESDFWRDTISDGKLELFQPEMNVAAATASNDNVYRGVRLMRTVVLTKELLIDVFRVERPSAWEDDEASNVPSPRQFDWALHCHGEPARPAGAEAVDLGQRRGYRYFTDAWAHPATSGPIDLAFNPAGGPNVRGRIWLPQSQGARLIVARDPVPDRRTPIGDREAPQPRSAVIVRTRAAEAVFVSVWSLTGEPVDAQLESASPGGEVTLTTHGTRAAWRWRVPVLGKVSRERV